MSHCFYCGERMQRTNRRGKHSKLERTDDHVIPTSRGGLRGPLSGNIVHCHRKCNEDKGDKTLEEYRAIVAERKGIPVEEFRFPGELREGRPDGRNHPHFVG